MSPNSASASQAGAHIPHAGKPLPGGKLKPAPWWSGFGQRWQEGSAAAGKNWTGWTKQWRSKNGKFQMPVHVDVDFLNPAIDSMKANTAAFWQRLPLPVQQAAPFVGAAGLSAMIVHRIGSSKLRAERERNQRLRGRLDILLNENEELHAKVSDLKVKLDVARLCNAIMVQSKAQGPRSPSELSMAKALAEATQAAASAATAAASAASACIRPYEGSRQVSVGGGSKAASGA